MNTKLVTAAAGVICRAMESGRRTPAGWAMALEAKGFLMSPEVAAELESLRARVAELEVLEPAPIQTCRVCGAGYTFGEPCSTCAFKARMAAEAQARQLVDDVSPQVSRLRALLAGQREAVEGEHYAAVHHTYRVGHDLPETGGQR